MMMNKIFVSMFLILCVGLFVSPVHAGIFDSKSMTEGGSLLSGTLKTTGIVAASFILPSVVTNMLAGGNKAAESTTGLASGIGTAGALIGGAFGGSALGMILGGSGALLGGIASIWSFTGDKLYSLDRGIVTRIISLDMNGAELYDPDYKIKGSDSSSGKFITDFNTDRQFLKKEKGVQYQYTPVMIKNKSKNLSKNPVETAVLQVKTYGLPEYASTNVANPSVATGSNLYANQAPYGQQYGSNNMMQSGYAGPQDPYADALKLDDAVTSQDIGWCEVNNKGKLTRMDSDVSDKYVEQVAESEKDDSFEYFVLLLKNLTAQDEQLNIPSFNCFGPNGLTGVTGSKARPKVEFKWIWSTVGNASYCSRDLNADDRVFCDSTQFMESLFARLYAASTQLANLTHESFTSTSDINTSNNMGSNVYDLLNFKASLMMDGYTLDFLNDFKEYVTQTSYLGFNTEQKNLALTMLPEQIKFLPLSGASTSPEGYKLPYAGYYNVTIEVVYDTPGPGNKYKIMDASWNLSSNVKQIYVYFEPISQENNPVYKMPLDATVGVKNGMIDRQGYGVDYSGDSIWFSQNQEEGILLEPTLRSNSSPIVGLAMTTNSETSVINGSMRGAVLQIIPKSTSAGASYSVNRFLSLPAYADLTIKKKSDDGAYAFYTVNFGNGPETAGNSFILWSLICDTGATKFDCESFSGLKPTDEMYIPDVIGVQAKVAPTGQLQGKVYGLEWDNASILRDGKHSSAMYRGLVYMPESTGANSLRLTNVIASDNMTINNTPSMYSEIRDIQQIYELMNENVICMSEENGGVGVRFWWNPAKVMGLPDNVVAGLTTLVGQINN